MIRAREREMRGKRKKEYNINFKVGTYLPTWKLIYTYLYI
jgi:hypothetical protein